MATVNGLALQERFINERNSLWKQPTLDDIFCSYAAYVTAGISAAPITLPPGRMEPWMAAADGGSNAPRTAP